MRLSPTNNNNNNNIKILSVGYDRFFYEISILQIDILFYIFYLLSYHFDYNMELVEFTT